MPAKARPRTVAPVDKGPSDWWLYGGGAALGLTGALAVAAIAKYAEKQGQDPRDLDALPTANLPLPGPPPGPRRSQNQASNAAKPGGSNAGKSGSNGSAGSAGSAGSLFEKGSRTQMQKMFGARKSKRVKQLQELQAVAQRARRWVNRNVGDVGGGRPTRFSGAAAGPLIDRIGTYTDPDQLLRPANGGQYTPALNREQLFQWLRQVEKSHLMYGISFDDVNPGSDWKELKNQLKILRGPGGKAYLT